jgi:hypothetical protein
MKNTLLTLALFSAFSANAATNLITDGSFESYVVATDSFLHVSAPDAGPWQPSSGAPNPFLEVQDNLTSFNANPSAQDGFQYVELNPLAQSGITQSFMASAGLGTVSWWSKSRFSASTYAYEVLLNGSSIFNGSASGTSWSQNLLSGLSLLQGNNTLTFNSLAVGDIGAHIDNVSVMQTSVAAIPEPETYAMFLAGLGLLGFAARRRQS